MFEPKTPCKAGLSRVGPGHTGRGLWEGWGALGLSPHQGHLPCWEVPVEGQALSSFCLTECHALSQHVEFSRPPEKNFVLLKCTSIQCSQFLKVEILMFPEEKVRL